MKLAVTSGTEKIITLKNTGTSYTIDWGDGTVETNQSGYISHTYNAGNSGTTANPIVSIGAIGDTGSFTAMQSSEGNANNPVLEVTQWGDIAWTTMYRMFRRNYNILITATDSPDLTNCSSFQEMFSNALTTAICTNGSINNWNVSYINNMSSTFIGANGMNADISNWDVSNVTDFNSMFAYASAFNVDISGWNVSSGQYFQNMLAYTSSFTVDIGNWNVSSALNMSTMFFGAGTSTNTTQNLSVKVVNSGQANQYLAWYTPLCQNFYRMFRQSYYANSTDFQNWNVSSVTNMKEMFYSTYARRPDSAWLNTANMTPKSVTLGGVTFNAWNTSSVTTFDGMFSNSRFNLDVSGWDVSGANDLSDFVSASLVNYVFDWTALNSGLSTMNTIFGYSAMSTDNYTDSIVHFANLVYNNSAPYTVDMGNQANRFFDRARSGGANFADAGLARDYLTGATANWSITGDTEIN